MAVIFQWLKSVLAGAFQNLGIRALPLCISIFSACLAHSSLLTFIMKGHVKRGLHGLQAASSHLPRQGVRRHRSHRKLDSPAQPLSMALHLLLKHPGRARMRLTSALLALHLSQIQAHLLQFLQPKRELQMAVQILDNSAAREWQLQSRLALLKLACLLGQTGKRVHPSPLDQGLPTAQVQEPQLQHRRPHPSLLAQQQLQTWTLHRLYRAARCSLLGQTAQHLPCLLRVHQLLDLAAYNPFSKAAQASNLALQQLLPLAEVHRAHRASLHSPLALVQLSKVVPQTLNKAGPASALARQQQIQVKTLSRVQPRLGCKLEGAVDQDLCLGPSLPAVAALPQLWHPAAAAQTCLVGGMHQVCQQVGLPIPSLCILFAWRGSR